MTLIQPEGRFSAGVLGSREVEAFEYVDPNPPKTPFGADSCLKPAMQPRKPSLNVLPQPLFIGSSLVKPAATRDQIVKGLQGGFEFEGIR